MNAAPHYRQAAALFATPTRAEEKILANVRTISLNQMTWEFIHRSEPALEELDRGAKLPECDWGPDAVHESGPQSNLTMQIYRLSQIACLRSRHAFRDRETLAAVADLLGLLTVSRHLGRGGTYLFKTIQLGMETLVLDVVAASLPGQDARTLQVLARGLETLPQAGTLFDTVRQEKQFTLSYGRSLVENKSRSEVLALLRQLASKEEAQAILHAAGDGTGLGRLIDAWVTLMDELAAIVTVSEDRLHAALAAFAERHRVTNPLVVPFVRLTEGVAYAVARAETRLAMLQAALPILRDGPEKRQTLAEAGSRGPFEFRPFKDGFEMRAILPFPGRPPVTLTFGQRKGLVQWLGWFIDRFKG